jgi:drug/metabolite transporter (DMT)-like permease
MHKTPILMALLSAILFGAATPASKLLLGGLTPFQLAGLLYLGAAIAVAPAALKSGGFALPPRADRRNQLLLAGAILFGGILGPVALLFGLRLAEAASVSLWLNLELAATAILGAVLFRDRLSPKGWFGVAAAILASMIVAWAPGNAGFHAGFLVFIACVCWGLDNHFTVLIDGITASQSTLWKGVVAGIINISIGVTLAPITVGIQPITIALIIGALSYGASIVLYIRSAQVIGATRAQVIFASAPFFGVALSVIFLGESLSIIYAIATPLFLLGVGLLLIDSHSHSHSHEATTHVHFHRHDDGHHTHTHANQEFSGSHIHKHTHEPVRHSHPHWPDIHHRHKHESPAE